MLSIWQIKDDVSLVLGSATPSIEEYYKAKMENINYLKLNIELIINLLPKIDIVDMKEELNKGNKSIFSNKLQK